MNAWSRLNRFSAARKTGRSKNDQHRMVQPLLHEKCKKAAFQLKGLKFLHLAPNSTSRLPAALFGCCLLILLASAYPTEAQNTELKKDQILKSDDHQPWVLESEELSYDQSQDRYIARGNVQLSNAAKKLTADEIHYDHKTQHASARGNVVLTIGQDILTGSYLEIDLNRQVGFVENATLFLKENNFHIKANKIEKTGENTYRIDAATLTTCDGEKPAWKITGKDIQIKSDGAGSAKHTTLWVRKVPVLYSPYLYYPATSDRQSGFLAPEYADSERKGTDYTQPFFWAISDSSDATLYAEYMSKRGLKLGSEYRYILSERAKGTMMLDGFKDQKVDDGTGDSKDRYGYEDDPVDVLRTNHDRFWLRASHHQQLPYDISAKLDLDIVSDQDYLRDFREGSMGYDDAERYFLKRFNRQLNDYNDPYRTNRLNLNRIWPKFSFNFEPRWNEDSQRDSNTSQTLQRLPFVGFDGEKQKILSSPFYFELASQYNYFWRDEGPRGQRMDLYPRFYLPFRAANYLTIEPSAGLRETAYWMDKDNFDDEYDNHQWPHRELFDTGLDVFTEISRVFDLQGQRVQKIKHAIRPQIGYEFIPDVNQSGLPRFDPIDQIDKINQITYSLTNTLTSKSRVTQVKDPVAAPPEAQNTSDQKPINNHYQEFFRFKVGQSYDFEKSKKEFSPIAAKLNITPGKYFAIDADAAWSVYDKAFLSHNVQTSLWDLRGDRFYVDYRYSKESEEIENSESIQSISGKLTLQVTDRLSMLAEHQQNIESNLRIRTTAGFSYKAQCWSFDFKYIDEPNDRAFTFKINLLGLGGVGY
jgi:LPS-assembly protein